MKIQTHTDNRRAMVYAISSHFGMEQQYMGPPSFGYKIGPFTVGRDASISGAAQDLRPLLPFLLEQGCISAAEMASAMAEADREEQMEAYLSEESQDTAATEEPASDSASEAAGENAADDEQTPAATDAESQEEPAPETAPEEEPTSVQRDDLVRLETGDLSPAALTNLILMLHSKQYLLGRALGRQTIRIPESLVARLQETPPQSMEEIAQLLGEYKASGELGGLDFKDNCLTLTFPVDEARPIYHEAVTTLVWMMAERAKEARRVQAELLQPEPDAEKYYMNSWLLRLGYSGADFKAHRHFLMEKLSGYAAFKTNEGMDRHKAKLAAARRELRDLRAAVVAEEASETQSAAEERDTEEEAGSDEQ